MRAKAEAAKREPMKGPMGAGGVPVASVARPVEAEDWPVAAAVPGDGERVAALLGQLAQVTDVGSLAMVLSAVVGQCRKQRVKPEVIAAAVQRKTDT